MAQADALVTGAGGFVGGRVVRALVRDGQRVRVLVRGPWRPSCPEHQQVEVAVADLRDGPRVRAAAAGCHTFYHVAADYRLGVRDPHNVWANNVEGTANLLAAARAAGARRVVHTSTVGTIGLPAAGGVGDEQLPLAPGQCCSHYKRSKLAAEQLALSAAAQGLGVVVVNPATPIGPGDDKPTPTGQLIVDFLAGRMPAYVDTGLNFVHVDDVAAGHLLAAERGQVGRRYILGGQNLTLRAFLHLVGQVAGRRAPRLRLPWPVAWAAAAGSEAYAALRRRPPAVAMEAVQMARRRMWFDSSRARRELGLPQTSLAEAVYEAVAWFCARRQDVRIDHLMPRGQLADIGAATT